MLLLIIIVVMTTTYVGKTRLLVEPLPFFCISAEHCHTKSSKCVHKVWSWISLTPGCNYKMYRGIVLFVLLIHFPVGLASMSAYVIGHFY